MAEGTLQHLKPPDHISEIGAGPTICFETNARVEIDFQLFNQADILLILDYWKGRGTIPRALSMASKVESQEVASSPLHCWQQRRFSLTSLSHLSYL